MYNFLEDGDFSNEYQEDADHLVEVQISSLHKITTRENLTPYIDMVHRITCHVSLDTCTILSDSKQVVGSFRPDHLEAMYALPTPKTNLDVKFLDAFVKK
jgi:hypothetical protein